MNDYSPDKEPGFSAILKRQAETHADFIYSLSGNVISIVDLNLGTGRSPMRLRASCATSSIITKARSSALKLFTAIPREFGMGSLGTDNTRHSSPCAKPKKDEL